MVTFTNKGNTCYFNVLLQIMLHTTHTTVHHSNKTQTGWYTILTKLRNLRQNMEFDPKLLMKFLKWNTYFKEGQKHDAHEAFLHLIDWLNTTDFQGSYIEFMITPNAPYERYCKHIPMTSIEISVTHNTLEKCLDTHFQTENIEGWKDRTIMSVCY